MMQKTEEISNKWKDFLSETLTRMGFKDIKVEIDSEHRQGNIFIHDQAPELKEGRLSVLVDALNHIMHVVAQKNEDAPLFIDINNYRKEREKLIAELARAAARKAIGTKEPVRLPVMNSYERRIIHLELAMNPEVVTESEGEGKERKVVVMPPEN